MHRRLGMLSADTESQVATRHMSWERMAAIQELQEAAQVAPVEAVNRISIPFLRVQERKWLLGAVDIALSGFWLWAAYVLWRAVMHPGSSEIPQVPWTWIIGGSIVWFFASWLAGAYELATADQFAAAAGVTFAVTAPAGASATICYLAFFKTQSRPGLVLAARPTPPSLLGSRGV